MSGSGQFVKAFYISWLGFSNLPGGKVWRVAIDGAMAVRSFFARKYSDRRG